MLESMLEGLQPRVIVGIDVHRRGRIHGKPFVLGIAEFDEESRRAKYLEIKDLSYKELWEYFERNPVDLVVYESTGTKYAAMLMGILEEKQIPALMIGSDVLGSMRKMRDRLKRKSDIHDIKGMLSIVEEILFPDGDPLKTEHPRNVIIPPPPESHRIRLMIHERERWDKEIARHLNRIEKGLAAIGIVRKLRRSRGDLGRMLKELRKEIEDNIHEKDGETWYNGWRLGKVQMQALEELRFLLSDEMIRYIQTLKERMSILEKQATAEVKEHRYWPVLTDIKGVGPWRATILIAWIWDIRRFKTPGRLKGYFKLLETMDWQSGGKSRRKKMKTRVPIIKKTLYGLVATPHRDERLDTLIRFYKEKAPYNTKGRPRSAYWVAIGKFLERLWYTLWEVERGNPEARIRNPRPWKGWKASKK